MIKPLIAALGICVFGCSTAARQPTTPIGSEQAAAIEALRQSLTWGKTVSFGPVEIRTKLTGEDGDALLFNALGCAAGDAMACAVVKASQDSDGRVWRSPARVGHEAANAFSRDMTMGGLLYASVTNDAEFGNKWASYIIQTKRLCPQDTDARCRLSPTTVAIWNEVAADVGFAKLPYSVVTAAEHDLKLGAFSPKLPTIPNIDDPKASAMDRLALALEPTTPLGFPLHLLGVQLFIKAQRGHWNGVLQKIAERMVDRQPLNPFFLYLKLGADKAVGDLVLAHATKDQSAVGNQWSFERADTESAWTESCAWDQLFIIGLLQNR